MTGAERQSSQAAATNTDLPPPWEFFGFAPGRDGHLADWAGICAYAHAAAQACVDVRVRLVGRSTEGRPLLAIVMGGAGHCLDAASEDTGRRQPTVVMLCGTHAAEAAAPQGIPALLHRFATGIDPILCRALRSVLLVVVPAVDPDGLDRMCAWMRTPAGQASAGAPPPGLYRRYAGHDINRDWIMQTQVEIRTIAESVLHHFLPQVVLDLHEMWPTGPRMFLPPYCPPTDPAADPEVAARASLLGAAIAERLRARGLTGIATGVIFDAYSPARCYPHYHGAVRILCETAGAGLASQIAVPSERLRPSGGLDPRVPSPAHPLPWSGGAWSSEDVMHYQAEAITACVDLVAQDASEWVRWQAGLLARSEDARTRDDAYFIPAAQVDPSALEEMQRVLVAGGVRVDKGTGGIAVPRAQRFGAWADVLLQPQPYPKIRRRGAPTAPYDVAAHCLPALLGLRCERRALQAAREGAAASPPAAPRSADPELLPASNLQVYPRLFAAMIDGHPVWRIRSGEGVPDGGAFLIQSGRAQPPDAWKDGAERLRPTRLAVYGSWRGGTDEGWLRYVLDRFEVPHVLLRDADVQGGIPAGLTHVVLPSMRGRDLMHGLPADRYGPRYAGGLGDHGRQQLLRHMGGGGTLVAIEWAAAWAHSAFGLPVRDRTLEPSPPNLGPSAILSVAATTGPLGMGAPERTWVMYRGGPAFITAPDVCAATFTGEPPAAGLADGVHGLAGSAAVADVPVKAGRCRMYAFSPYFRAQSWTAMRWLFNGLLD